jgi:galactosylceramidase
VIVETSGAKAPQNVTFKLASGLRSLRPLCVWRTTRDEQFVRQADVTPAPDGTLALTLEAEAIYSLSTTRGQQKGTFADVPKDKPFPFPYFENFDHYADASQWGYLPHYTADICGVFEIADRPRSRGGNGAGSGAGDDPGGGKCLRQVVRRKAQSWAPEWMPYTVIGDANWADYEVSADLLLEDGGWAGVMGRVCNTGNGWEGNPDGYYARLYGDGGCALYLASQKIKGSRDRQLAVGQAGNWQPDRWHNLKLRFEGRTITVLVDGEAVLTAEDTEYPRGMAGLICGGEGRARNTALYDNLLINRVNGPPVAPTTFEQDAHPIYRRR